MEDQFYLDVHNENDLYCLHLLYLPCINLHLELFRNTYINHKLRTENNLSPLQLWTTGNLNHPMPDLVHNIDPDSYGIEHDSYCFEIDHQNDTLSGEIVVPRTSTPLNELQDNQVRNRYNKEFIRQNFCNIITNADIFLELKSVVDDLILEQ
jgi:hypothetical protein